MRKYNIGIWYGYYDESDTFIPIIAPKSVLRKMYKEGVPLYIVNKNKSNTPKLVNWK